MRILIPLLAAVSFLAVLADGLIASNAALHHQCAPILFSARSNGIFSTVIHCNTMYCLIYSILAP